jgi:hypothetical protein
MLRRAVETKTLLEPEEDGSLHASACATAPADVEGAEMGESGEGLVAGERVEEGVPRGDVAQGGGDVGEDDKGCAE